ncbi:MAG TPA: hypothetical protein PLE03_02065 [Bacteroidia bacterium]|nr:hypothetical protein [Bacteroidia bacterium]HNJ30678.1 hypothetical protein [Bacteroidia bacterium]
MEDFIGFIGVFILLVAYFLHLFRVIKPDKIFYLLLNFIGASLACLASVLIHYMPFILLEAAWALVSLISIFKLLLSKPLH